MRALITVPTSLGSRHVLVDGPEDLTAADVHAHLGAPGVVPAPRRPLHGYAVGAPDPAPVLPLPRLVVADGPDAGASVALPPGVWVTLGRDPSCALPLLDPALSRRHARVRTDRTGVVVDDRASTNGVHWSPDHREGTVRGPTDDARAAPRSTGAVDGSHHWPTGCDLLVGGSRLVLLTRPGAPLPVRHARGRAEVRPWPRTVPPRPVTSLTTPPPPEPPVLRPPSAWSWGVPLAASVALAAVLRMPFLLLFGLMAPAMMFGHHLGERRRARVEHLAATARHGAELTRLGDERRHALGADLSVLRSRHPGLGAAVSSLLPTPTTDLWSRVHEAVEVVLGRAGCPSAVTLDGVPVDHADAPLVLDLAGPVTVVGPPHLRDALVRSVLLQAVTTHPPSALSLVVDPGTHPGDAWDLLAWLPHTRPVPGDEAVAVRWGQHLSLVEDVRDAPAGRTRIEVAGPARAVLRRPGEPDVVFLPTMLGLPLARHLARMLAGWAEEDPDAGHGTATAARTLGDLTSWPTHPLEVRQGWASGQGPGLAGPLGTDDGGRPVVVDLVRDGPHALVAGTTGAGKSELLRTLVTGLALAHPPSRLGVLLMDYKGGASLGQLADLPHAVGLVTDLDPYLARRVLASLRAELGRRERALGAAGLRDVSDDDAGLIPRLLIVVDEFRVLAEELPEFLTGLVRVATVGRSLGVHLVLATQRPGGAVPPDLRANVNLRVALRVREVADSLDVLEVPDAARLPEDRPGAALLRTGSGPARAFRAVRVGPPSRGAVDGDTGDGGPTGSGAGRCPVRTQEVVDAWAGWRALTHGEGGPATTSSGASPTDALGDLVDLVRRAAAEAPAGEAPERAAPVWHPPLPDRWPEPAPGTWALADRPDQQSQEPLVWRATGHLSLVGAPRSGRSTAVRALVAAAGRVWLYVLDPARGLEGTELASHPGLRAWVGPDEPAHGTAVLRALAQLVDRRRTRGGADGAPVVLVVDGWDRWVQEQEVALGDARDLVVQLLRDGPAAGVSVLLTGDRQLVTGSVARHVPETWLLPTHDPTDTAAAGLRPAQVPRHRPPGRAVRTRDALVAQVHLPPPSRHVRAPSDPPPPRLVALPRLLSTGRAWAVGGDRAEPVPCPAGSVLVLGPPGSGVTHALSAIAQGAEGAVLRVGGPGERDERELSAALVGGVGTVVLDEAHLLLGSRTEELVLAWAERTGGRLLVGGELAACSSLFRGAVPFVGRHRTGLVLQPSLPGHGAALGVDLPVGDVRVPGRGVLVVRGRATRVQVRAPAASPTDP